MRTILAIIALTLLIAACQKTQVTEQPTDTATVRGAMPAKGTETPAAKPSTAQSSGDACDRYLTTAEINAACGTSLGSYETGTGTPCDRTYPVSEDTLFAYNVAGPQPDAVTRQAYDIAKESRKTVIETQAKYGAGVSVTQPVFEPVAGLGDDSYKSDAGNGQLNINFRKGQYSVYLLADPGLCTWSGMETLARKVAGGLP